MVGPVSVGNGGNFRSWAPNPKIEENKVPTKRKNINFHFSMSLYFADGTEVIGREACWDPASLTLLLASREKTDAGPLSRAHFLS